MTYNENFIEAKIALQNSAFGCARLAGIDIEDMPTFIREVVKDIENEIKRQR